jgi:SAM-dependent methyltransferase
LTAELSELRDLSRLYDAHYFATACGVPYERNAHWLGFFGSIADRIVADIQPGTVLDAGCAMGLLVEALRDRGVDCFGVDVSEYAIQKVREDIRPYCWVGSVSEPFPQEYDLIVCIEVVEHLAPQEADGAVRNLCQHTDDILFSSTPQDYSEATHLSVRPQEQWAESFAREGFFRDVDFDASFASSWAVRFLRRRDPFHRLVRGYERALWTLRQENVALRGSMLERQGPADVAEHAAKLAEAQRKVEELGRLLDTRDEEIARLGRLVDGYERGRFIRFMRWAKGLLRRQ